MTQVLFAAIIPPARASAVLPLAAVGLIVPPHVLTKPGVFAIRSPLGKLSATITPVNAVLAFAFVSVNCNTDVPPVAMVAGVNDLAMLGAEKGTVALADPLVV